MSLQIFHHCWPYFFSFSNEDCSCIRMCRVMQICVLLLIASVISQFFLDSSLLCSSIFFFNSSLFFRVNAVDGRDTSQENNNTSNTMVGTKEVKL